jgi:hypothetical protein
MVRFPIFREPNTDTFLAGMPIFLLAGLLYENITCLHCCLKSILLEATMRYGEYGPTSGVIFEQGYQAKPIPNMFCAKFGAEPILWLILWLG